MLGQSELMGFIPTGDAERATAFYCGLLGLEQLEDNGFAIFLKARHATIRLTRVQSFTPFPFTLLGWEVAEIGSEVARLTAVGVVFERYTWFEQDPLGIWTAPGGARVAWFKDPDGNLLSLAQTA